MMGWMMLIAAALLAAVLLVLLRFPRAMWTIPATAVTLGAAGYAWQGSPALEGSIVAEKKQGREVDPGLIAMREAMFGRFNLEDAYFKQADAMVRIGKDDMAARAMLGAIAKVGDDAALWTWLGVTLSDSERGLVSPASRYAFDHAIAIAPKHPGPPYFLGLMLARNQQYAETRKLWAKAVELSPENAGFRTVLVDQLGRLDAFLATQGAVAVPAPQATPAP
jgi:cytochrome c-type biogenesis protein CcmH